MLVSLEGLQGSGKSTSAAALAYEDHKESGRKIISNIHLSVDYTKFDIAYFLEHIADSELENCILIMDEFYQIADSRSSGSKLNKLWSYFIVQTRKRGVDMYICTHFLDHIDKRNRRAVDIRGACRTMMESPCKRCKGTGRFGEAICDRCLGYKKVGWIRVNFYDRRYHQRYPWNFRGNDYWWLFDTHQRIPLQQKLLSGIDTLEVG